MANNSSQIILKTNYCTNVRKKNHPAKYWRAFMHLELRQKKQTDMKNRRAENIRKRLEALWEGALEWCSYFSCRTFRKKGFHRSISVKYSISKEWIEKEFVRDFLEERERIALINRYKITVDSNYTGRESNEIGVVMLCRKKRCIERATLSAGKEIDGSRRIIHWNVNK